MLSTGMNVGDGKTAISCLSFVADFQNMIHEGGKVSVLYFDATETELQNKNLSKGRWNASKPNLHIFAPLLEANNFQ